MAHTFPTLETFYFEKVQRHLRNLYLETESHSLFIDAVQQDLPLRYAAEGVKRGWLVKSVVPPIADRPGERWQFDWADKAKELIHGR